MAQWVFVCIRNIRERYNLPVNEQEDLILVKTVTSVPTYS